MSARQLAMLVNEIQKEDFPATNLLDKLIIRNLLSSRQVELFGTDLLNAIREAL